MYSTKINIVDYLPYADERQIKPIFQNDNCKITLLVFKKGQGLPEHTTPIDAFLQVVEGECELTMSGKTHLLKTNDAIILPKGKVHEVWAKTMNTKLVLTR